MYPGIFTQLFTIFGTITRKTAKGKLEITLPFAHALLSSKETCQYTAVLEAVVRDAGQIGVNTAPDLLINDFELAIVNICEQEFPHVAISLCLFHLKQSMYKQVQAKGLQVTYNDDGNRTLKNFVHMLAALAFVPISDVEDSFTTLKQRTSANMREYFDYFDTTYVYYSVDITLEFKVF